MTDFSKEKERQLAPRAGSAGTACVLRRGGDRGAVAVRLATRVFPVPVDG
jgi:hypothetical protein